MTSGRVVLAGGSGFLGRALAEELLRQDYEVVVLTRTPKQNAGAVRQIEWNGTTTGAWVRELEGAEAVINLAGKSVNCRYTAANRRGIVRSRLNSVNAIGRAILACERPPRAFVQAASLAIYGDAGSRICDEFAPFGRGFPVETCLAWERAFDALDLPETRKVLLRIGFALGRGGGALRTLALLAKCYLGGTTGSGRQYISWLHVNDLNRIFLRAVECEEMRGVFNATGPQPVTNEEFMQELRCALRRPWSPRVPAWAVRIGARLMGTEGELALTGRRCLPERLLEKNFRFGYTSLGEALLDIVA